MKQFSEKLLSAVLNHKTFVLFRKPDEDKVQLVVDDVSGKNCFLIHSFDSQKEISISDVEPALIHQTEFKFGLELKLKSTNNLETSNQTEYEQLIQKTIDKIKNSAIRKIVISRIKLIENNHFNLLKSFAQLLSQHSSALVYLWHNPNGETWMGATPELLLSFKNRQLNTVSLAGTKLSENEWTAKEIDEQQIVTDYILSAMTDFPDLKSSGPETVQAGKFQHLKSYISAGIPKEFDLHKLLQKLHPTPAVCGLPKEEAFDFIIKNEGYDREFYSGYLGIENNDSKTYFVNLRCAQFFDNNVRIYVGGGITANSQSEKEWAETELKSGTILNVLTNSLV